MRVAFDLDDTLIPGRIPFDVEPVPRGLIRRLFCTERLRRGTVRLFQSLWGLGHEVCIYTTSFRGPLATKLLFRGHGTRVGRVINRDVHAGAMKKLGEEFKTCAKYPPAFGINVLVDDCEGVLLESREFGFAVVTVKPDDGDWIRTVAQGLGIDVEKLR